MIKIVDKIKCCGCNACVERCPNKCITMKMDKEGFFYPLVDESECIHCNLCEKVCPFINQHEPVLPITVYAAKNKDKVIVSQSSSGGIFSAIAENIIREKNGVVFGAIYDEKWNVVMSFTEIVDGLKAMRGSKYVQCDIRNCYTKAEAFLKQGRTVLFSGTPCQIAGLKSYLRKDYNNLYTVSIICHGVPSPGIWNDYKKVLPAKLVAGKNTVFQSLKSLPVITGINFRDKTEGWQKYGFSVKASADQREAENSVFPPKHYSFFEQHHDNLYMRGFLNNIYLRPSCYHCPARKGKSRADIQLGDYWGVQRNTPEFYDPNGVSLVLLYTEKGDTLFNELDVVKMNVGYKAVLDCNANVEFDEIEPAIRGYFFDLYRQIGFKAVRSICNKVEGRTFLTQIKHIIKRVLLKSSI